MAEPPSTAIPNSTKEGHLPSRNQFISNQNLSTEKNDLNEDEAQIPPNLKILLREETFEDRISIFPNSLGKFNLTFLMFPQDRLNQFLLVKKKA